MLPVATRLVGTIPDTNGPSDVTARVNVDMLPLRYSVSGPPPAVNTNDDCCANNDPPPVVTPLTALTANAELLVHDVAALPVPPNRDNTVADPADEDDMDNPHTVTLRLPV